MLMNFLEYFFFLLRKLYIQTKIMDKVKSRFLHKRTVTFKPCEDRRRHNRRIFRIQKLVPHFEGRRIRNYTRPRLHPLGAKFVSCAFPRDLPIRKTDCARSFGSNERDIIPTPWRKIFCCPSYFCQRRKRVHCQRLRSWGERAICSVLFCMKLSSNFRVRFPLNSNRF